MSLNKKLRLGVLGNCQAEPVAKLMRMNNPLFKEKYEVHDVIALHRITDLDTFLERCGGCDILLTQPFKQIHGSNFNLEDLRKTSGKQTVVYPNLYFEGYYPFYGYLRSTRKKTLKPIHGDYVNFLLLALYLNKTTRNQIVGAYNAVIEKSAVFFQKHARQSLATLRSRDTECNFGVADFIEEHYQSILLFKTINHPTRAALDYVVEKLFEQLGCAGSVDNVPLNPLKNSRMEIHKVIGDVLSLEFTYNADPHYHRVYSFNEFVQISFEFFDAHDECDLLHGLDNFLKTRPALRSMFIDL